MTDQDQKNKVDSDSSNEKVDSSIKPELLGVELSEEIKKVGTDFIEAVSADKPIDAEPAPAEVENDSNDPKDTDVEINSSESIPPLPKKEFSMPEQSKQVEDIVETYISNPTIANSTR